MPTQRSKGDFSMEEKNNTVRPRGTDSARVIQVIETSSITGRGTFEDPVKEVRQYWSFDGRLLANSTPTTEPENEENDKTREIPAL